MKLPTEVTRSWELRLPDLYGKWTHWKVTGDCHCIAIVHGENLAQAIRVVEDNYGRYSSIKACRAAVDQNGDLIEEEEKAVYEISNYSNDEKVRERRQ
jgi:hypothetical protein